MSKPAITSMIMCEDSGQELDVSDVVLAIYSIYSLQSYLYIANEMQVYGLAICHIR